MRGRFGHLYSAGKLNRLISSTIYHHARNENLDGHSINLVTGPRDATVIAGDRPVREDADIRSLNLLKQLSDDISFIVESTYRLEVVQHTQLEQLHFSDEQLENLRVEVTELKDFPKRRDNLLDILKRKVLEEIDNRIEMLENMEKVIKSSSNKIVKELSKLEREVKMNSNKNRKMVKILKEPNHESQNRTRVTRAGTFRNGLTASDNNQVGCLGSSGYGIGDWRCTCGFCNSYGDSIWNMFRDN
ncbi:hypothetical protein HOY82DRAFT_631227 [Tuber indicum]|nr:hypothetical protein HOY82DRAFT_631227 [Tuber indicum]